MLARELMTPDLTFGLPDDTIEDAARKMRDQDIGLIPVVNDPEALRLEGVITDRDIAVRHVAEGCVDCPVSGHMTTDVATVDPDADADTVMLAMKEAQVRRVPVVDEERKVTGIIAQADLALRLGKESPEEVEEVLEAVSA